jgi:hypothetical protein
MLAHSLWNVRQTPAGLQLALFNVMRVGSSPDGSVPLESSAVWIPATILCGFMAAGLFLIFRAGFRQGQFSRQQIWGWIALLCGSAAAVSVILTASARPATMFILAIAIRAAAGRCFQAVLERWPRLTGWSSAASFLLTRAVFLLPSIYQLRPSPRLLLQAYRRLVPARKMFAEPGATLAATEFEGELNAFSGYCACPSLRFDLLKAEARRGHPFGEVLNQHGVTLFLADERTIDDPVLRDFPADPGAYHLGRPESGSHSFGELDAVSQGSAGRRWAKIKGWQSHTRRLRRGARFQLTGTTLC